MGQSCLAYQSCERDEDDGQDQPTASKSRPEIEVGREKLETDG